MDATLRLTDCQECRGVRTVILDVCYVCFAEFGERDGWDADDEATILA